MHKLITYYLLILLPVFGWSQNFNITTHRSVEQLFIHQIDTAANFHSGIKPYSSNEINPITPFDTIRNNLKINTQSSFINQLFNENLIEANKKNYSLFINPLINAGGGIEKSSNKTESIYENAFGLNIETSIRKKWSGQLSFLADNSRYLSHIDYILKSTHAGQGYGYTNNLQSLYYQGNITFTADEIFTFQAGIGKHFLGDGYRSLFLSDYANSYPYFKATANIWKIKYIALYTNFQDIRYGNGSYNDFRHKFSTIHYLSYNATKWLNLNFFESIIFQAQEGNFYRGFEISYMNPVIFLRPVEYHQGSADNALLGGGFKIKIKKNNIFYGQLLLDEFLLSEIKSNRGWWANKYGYQIGVKMYNPLGIKNLKLQAELNVVRPFTYSYFEDPSTMNTLQNYAHYNSPLAHPMGANFREAVGIVSYSKKRWKVELLNTFATVGLDTSFTYSIGQDLYRPYNQREKEFGYQIAGGVSTSVLNQSLKVNYLLNPKMNTIISLEVGNRKFKNSYVDESSNWITFGIKTAFINQYFDI